MAGHGGRSRRVAGEGAWNRAHASYVIFSAFQLREINDQLSRLAEDTDNPPSQSMLRAIQRHREVYQDYARELRRTKVSNSIRHTLLLIPALLCAKRHHCGCALVSSTSQVWFSNAAGDLWVGTRIYPRAS